MSTNNPNRMGTIPACRWPIGHLLFGSHLAFSVFACVFIFAFAFLNAPGEQAVAAQKPKPEISPDDAQLVDRIPFDRIYLNDDNKFATVDIVPPEKIPTRPLPKSGVLKFEWVEDDEYRLEVPWGAVIDYKTFNELLLEESQLLVEQKNYSRSFRNLLFVFDHGGDADPQLENSLRENLLLDGKRNFDLGNYSLALSIFEDAYQRAPANGGPSIGDVKAIDMIMEGYGLLLKKRFDAGDLSGVRAVLDAVERKYGTDISQLKIEWNERLTAQHDQFLAETRKAFAAGDIKSSHQFARKAIYAKPDSTEAIGMLKQVIEKFPLVQVGVSQTALKGGDPTRIEHWGARRIGRLTQRTVVEFAGLSDEGGLYDFLNGKIVRMDEDGFQYQFKISKDPLPFGVPPLTAYQLSQQLLDRADAESPQYFEPWAKIAGPIEITDSTTVSVQLRVPFIRPEALLQMPYEPKTEKGSVQNGPYTVTQEDDQITAFSPNPNYPATAGVQYPEVVEVKFANQSDSVEALLRGDIDVVDRVPLQYVRKLSLDPAIEVQKYIVPTMHMLIPNVQPDSGFWTPNTPYEKGQIVRISKTTLTFKCATTGISGEQEPHRPGTDGSIEWVADTRGFMKSLNFRSSLMRAIDRQSILANTISGGREISGCEVVNGPFPVGTEYNDQNAYAYDPRVPKVAFDRILSMTLTEVVRGQMLDSLRAKKINDPSIEVPTITLAFPAGERTRSVCQAIQAMWAQINVKSVLRELPPGQIVPDDNDYDFLYLEMTINEPLTDIEKLFGAAGIAKQISPPVRQLSQKVGYATSWQLASRQLRQIHRQSLNGLSVVPLFQVQEYFAYRKNVTNIGRNLVSLYENIDQWKVKPPVAPTQVDQ